MTGAWRSKKLLFILLVFVLSTVGLFWYLMSHDVPLNPVKRQQNFRGLYVAFQQNYSSGLQELVKPKYADSALFTVIGPPMKAVFNESSKMAPAASKTILLWTSFYGKKHWIPELRCGGTEVLCQVTTDQNDLLHSDAVIMHPVDLSFLPTQRLPNQRWVYFVQEPPYLAYMTFEKYNGVFNWTSTYRWDSDFPATLYSSAKLQEPLSYTNYSSLLSEIISKKKKKIAIMHRNCHPKSKRFEILNKLRGYINVDFYGKCGTLSCERHTKKCQETMAQYKFYLAFENSNCRNYITEKVWKPLHLWNSVPIVFGAPEEDYAKALPPHSYIFLEGFSSIRKLAEYITLLDENPELYEKYHAWRRTHTEGNFTFYCDMCKALYNDSMPVKTYADFKGWYDQDICVP